MIKLEAVISAIACVLLGVSGVHGQNLPTVVLPPVDLAATEIAQVSIMSAASDYPDWGFTNPCQAVVNFYGADGSVLGTPATFAIGKLPQIFSAQLPYSLTGATGSSVFVSAQVAISQADGAYSGATPIPKCASLFSLSTYDAATGVTHAFTVGQLGFGIEVGSVQVIPCTYLPSTLCSSQFLSTPSQVITLPPVGLASSETVEVGVMSSAVGYSESPGVCGTSTITFYGADGSAIGAPTSFIIGKTSQIFSARLPYAGTGARIANTAVSAQIALNTIPGPIAYDFTIPPCAMVFSMKTFDSSTGITHAFLAGQSMPASLGAATGGGVSVPPEHRGPAAAHGQGK